MINCYGEKHLRNDLFRRIVFKVLRQNSSVVGLFTDFLTRGLSFVKNC